jgi:hypothetical protein
MEGLYCHQRSPTGHAPEGSIIPFCQFDADNTAGPGHTKDGYDICVRKCPSYTAEQLHEFGDLLAIKFADKKAEAAQAKEEAAEDAEAAAKAKRAAGPVPQREPWGKNKHHEAAIAAAAKADAASEAADAAAKAAFDHVYATTEPPATTVYDPTTVAP